MVVPDGRKRTGGDGQSTVIKNVPTKATQRGPMVRIVKRPVDLQSGAKFTGFGCDAQEKIEDKATIRIKAPASPNLSINISAILTLLPEEVVDFSKCIGISVRNVL